MPRIMLVDNDYSVKLALEAMLVSMGYDVVGQANSGEQAIEMAKDLEPDVILMDIVMPGHMDGISAAEKIRSELDVAIVFLTGYGDLVYVERAKQVEPFGYVMKPWTDEEIRASVEIAFYKKETGRKLRESEQKYRFLAENMADMVWTVDRNLRTTYVSPSIEKVLGFTPDERKQQSLEEMITPESAQEVQKTLMEEIQRDQEDAVDLDRSITMEIEYYRKDGSTVWMENKVKMIRDSKNAFAGIIGVSRDITERKIAEATIRGSEKKYRSLFEKSPIGIATLDEERNILDFNDTMLEINGYTQEDIGTIPNTSEYYYNPEDKIRVSSELSKKGFVNEMEIRFKRKDGTPYDALLSMKPIEIESQSLWHAMIQDISDRKRAEHEIRKSLREWEGIFQAIGHPTLILDTHHRLIHANAATEKATGKPEADLIGKRCYEIFHHTDGPPEGCPCEKMIASGHLETVEMEMEALGCAFLVSCTPMVDNKGRIEKVIHIATDISARRKAEQALRQSEHKFHLLFDNAPIGYQSLDENGCFLDVNQAWLNILGYERHEVIGKWFGDFLPSELADIFREKFKQNIQSHGLIKNVEFPLMRKDGSIVLADYMARIGRDEEGRFLRTHCAFSDITEKRKAEEVLKRTQRLLTETEKIGKVGGWEFNIDTKEQTWTEEVYKIHEVGLTYNPTVRKGINFYTPASRPIIEQAVQQAINHGEPFDLELEIITAKGNLRTVHTIGKAELEHRRICGFFQDITEKKRLQAQLLQFQKAESIATLAGGIAHDYNNLLAVIMGNLSMAQEEAEPHSAMAELLHEIEQASYKARDLTHQFLTLSQGGHPMKELGSMESLLKEILGQVQAHEVSTTSSIQNDLWPVEYDSRQMHYAINNVLMNAVEAMPQGGTIALQAENLVIENQGKNSALSLRKGKYVRVSIQDEGRGIPEEHLSRIFDPYFSTKERGVQKGMGMGLTTAYAVVQKHGGNIMVNSITGVGTTVTIYLSAMGSAECGMRSAECDSAPAERKSTTLSEDKSEIQYPKSEIKRILVMDDEESLRTLAQKMLERLEYKVETVKDGVEAIETYKKHMDSGEPFDAVILDLTIKGGMGGVQAIKELIKIDPDVKAIVCSGYFNDPVLTKHEEHGFRGAMAKPYQKADLESVLKKVLG